MCLVDSKRSLLLSAFSILYLRPFLYFWWDFKLVYRYFTPNTFIWLCLSVPAYDSPFSKIATECFHINSWSGMGYNSNYEFFLFIMSITCPHYQHVKGSLLLVSDVFDQRNSFVNSRAVRVSNRRSMDRTPVRTNQSINVELGNLSFWFTQGLVKMILWWYKKGWLESYTHCNSDVPLARTQQYSAGLIYLPKRAHEGHKASQEKASFCIIVQDNLPLPSVASRFWIGPLLTLLSGR